MEANEANADLREKARFSDCNVVTFVVDEFVLAEMKKQIEEAVVSDRPEVEGQGFKQFSIMAESVKAGSLKKKIFVPPIVKEDKGNHGFLFLFQSEGDEVAE